MTIGKWIACLSLAACLAVGCAQADTRCPVPLASKHIYATHMGGDGVVAFEHTGDEDHPLKLTRYRKADGGCAAEQVARYSLEGAPPDPIDVFEQDFLGSPHLFVIIAWKINNRAAGTYGTLYQIYGYTWSKGGALVSDEAIENSNLMTGIEGTAGGEDSHFSGNTTDGARKLLARME